MTHATLVAGGIGVGAALMYLLDPQRGRRRRAQLRDQLTSTAHRTACRLDMAARDLSHRARGLAVETRAMFKHEEQPPDRVLADRVRAALGRSVSHPHAIQVDADRGHVTLSGPILAGEVPHLLACVSSVHGVQGVANELDIHEEAGRFSALQGGRTKSEDAPTKWSTETRLLAGAVGGGLMANCLARRTVPAALLGTVGFGLFMRGLTNLQLTRLAGLGNSRQGHRSREVRKTLTVRAPVEEVYEFWTHFANFPRFMGHLREVQDLGGGRSRWVATGPAGVPISWTATITQKIPNELIAWESEAGSAVANAGVVRFAAAPDGGTRVDIRLFYSPPAGALGHLAARLFGADPKSALDEDLVRLKSLLDRGKASAPGKHVVTREELVGARGSEVVTGDTISG